MTSNELTKAFHELRIMSNSTDTYTKKQARNVERVCRRIIGSIQSKLTTDDLTVYAGHIGSRFEMKNVVAITMRLISMYGQRSCIDVSGLDIPIAVKNLKAPANRRILIVQCNSKENVNSVECPLGIPDNIDVLWDDFFADYFEKGPIHYENCFSLSNMHDWSARGTSTVRIERKNAGYWGFRYLIDTRLK